MNLLKEGVIYKNEKLWRDTTKEYHLCFGLGNWEPSASSSLEIFQSETSDVRFKIEQNEITNLWNNQRGMDEVTIDKTITPQSDIRFNRMFISINSRLRSKYKVEFNSFNVVSIVEPNTHPFLVGDRVFCKNNFYEVTNISNNLLSLNAYSMSPPLPNSGSGDILDASGTLLIGSVCDNQYIIKKDSSVNIILEGSTFK